jgi:hypothetical protein
MSSHSFQIDSTPVFRTALDAGTRCPGDSGFIDVLAKGRVRFISVIYDDIEPHPLLAWLQADLVEWNRRLNTKSAGIPARPEARAWCGFFDGPLIGVCIPCGSYDTGGVEWEDADLVAPHGVLGSANRIDADLDGVTPPVALDVIGRDVGNDSIIPDFHVHEQCLAVVRKTEGGTAVGVVAYFSLHDVGPRD